MSEYSYSVIPDMSGICITSVKNTESIVDIPSVIDGIDVVEIGENAFYGNCNIEYITVPSSVKTIKQGAFHGIHSLREVRFSEGLRNLGECDKKGFGVFLGCNNIKKVKLPDSLEVIGDKCFSGCEELCEISLGSGLIKIGAYAFERTSINNLVLPENVRSISEGAFLDSRLKEIKLNNGIKEIGAEAFSGCRLKGLNIVSSVETIGSRFCSSLYGRSNFRPSPRYGKSILVTAEEGSRFTIEDNCILSSDKKKILQAMNKTEFQIPSCAEIVCKGVLESSEYIEKLIIPRTVKRIEDRAFFGINTINTLVVTDSSIYVGEEAFAFNGRDGVKTYYDELMLKELRIISASDDSLICKVLYPGKCIYSNLYGREFAKTLTAEDDGTFFDGSLYDETLQKLRHSSFKIKASVMRLMYPYKLSDKYREVYKDYLKNNSKEAICNMIDEDNMELLNAICSDVDLSDDIISDSVAYAEEKGNGEAAAMLLHVNSSAAEEDNGFVDIDDLFDMDFFAEHDSDEVIETNWELEEYDDHIRILSFKGSDENVNVPMEYHSKPIIEIGDGAFADSDIETVQLSENIESIGEGVWSGCEKLRSVRLSEKLKSLPSNSFFGCISLNEITIHEGIEHIGDNAFYKCGNLQSVKLPASCVSIGDSAFCDCSGMNSIIISSAPEKMGEMIFRNCVGLIKAVLPDELTVIPEWTFAGCRSLQSQKLPQKLKKIGSHAFFNCISLKKITFPESLNFVGSRAFSGCRSLGEVEILGDENNIDYGEWVYSGCTELNKIDTIEKEKR